MKQSTKTKNKNHLPIVYSQLSRARARKGFTLVETLVALSLFVIVFSIAAGGFVRALRTQRQLTLFSSTNSNVSLAIEQIAREIRTGKGFVVPAGRNDELSFVNAANNSVVYRLNTPSSTIEKSVDGGGTFLPIISGNVEVKSLQFFLRFETSSDFYPARVTITINVVPKIKDLETTEIHLQTTISARNLTT